MIEWRDSDEWVANGREDEYANLSCTEIENMSVRFDGMFKNYIKGAIEGRHDYGYAEGNASQRATFNYSDVSTNAYKELVVTDTAFELEHITYAQGLMVEMYNVTIVRQNH